MRDYITIKLVSNIEKLADALQTKLESAGYKTKIKIDKACDQVSVRAGSAFTSKIEELLHIHASLKPFQFRTITIDRGLEHSTVIIRLGIQKPLTESIEIFSPTSLQEKTIEDTREQGISATIHTKPGTGASVLRYRGDKQSAAALLAWQLNMPEETQLERCDHLSCAAQAILDDADNISRQRRKYQPISIRAKDGGAANAYADYLESLGYRIHCVILDDSEARERFGFILCNYSERDVQTPEFRWLLNDLKAQSEAWLESRQVDVGLFPFEAIATDCKTIFGMHSIFVDLPLDRVLDGSLKPYSDGSLGRYTFTINAPDPLSEDVRKLEAFLRNEIGVNEVYSIRNKRVREYSITFGKDVFLQPVTRKKIATSLQQFISSSLDQSEGNFKIYNSKLSGVTINYPSQEMSDRSSLKIQVQSNLPYVVDRIASVLKGAGHQVQSIYSTNPAPHEISLKYNERTTYEEVLGVERLLKPLTFNIGDFDWGGETKSEFDISISITIDLRDSERAVQIIAPNQTLIDQAHANLSNHGFGVVMTAVREVDYTWVKNGLDCLSTASFVAWVAGENIDCSFSDAVVSSSKEDGPFTTIMLKADKVEE